MPGRLANLQRTIQCKSCGKKTVGFGGQQYCSKECSLPTCQAPMCSQKCSARRVKYCSPTCRNAWQKPKPGRPKGHKATKTEREMVCIDCQKQYVGHFNSRRCENCGTRPCRNDGCTNRVKWAKTQKTFCSEACKSAGLFAVLSAGSLGVSRNLGKKQSESHRRKRLRTNLNSGVNRNVASKEEKSLIPTLNKYGYKHSGNGSFWRRWKDGTNHNPDFYDEGNKRVFEYFGAYWHKEDIGREKEICAKWAEIGYHCIILWSTDRLEFLKNPAKFMGGI